MNHFDKMDEETIMRIEEYLFRPLMTKSFNCPFNCSCEFCVAAKIFAGNKGKLGVTVEVIKNEKLFKLYNGYEDEIPKAIREICGKKVKIVQIFEDGDYEIKYKNKSYIINGNCIVEFKNKSEYSDSSSDSDNLDGNAMFLYGAICTGNVTQVITLINAFGPEKKMHDTYPIALASLYKNQDIVKFLLDKKAEVNVKDDIFGDTALHCAVKVNEFDICSILVEHGADVNSLNNQKMTPIMLAAHLGFNNILKLLASRKEADLTIGNSNNETALHLAIHSEHIKCVETLLDIGGCPKSLRKNQDLPFHVAIIHGDERIVELFINKFGSSIINFKEGDNHVAIHYAIMKHRIKCLKVLIEHKADINALNFSLHTPLHLSVMMKHLDCVKMLVENKAALELKDEGGYTPLHIGIYLHNMDILKLRTKASEKEIREMKDFPRGSDKLEDIVEYLAKAGARLDTRNACGKTPLDDCKDVSLKKRLIAILSQKKRPKTAKIASVPPKSIAVEKSAAVEQKKLYETIKQLKDEATCKMCNERRRSTVFGCGHTACDICAKNLSECRRCSFSFGVKIRMID